MVCERLRRVKKTLDELDHVSLAIGEDGRNRHLGGLFGTITGRNNPRGGALLHRARWWRNLIQPAPGWALASLDFSSEEFLVQAVLAGDAQGIADYQSGDVYVAWGRTLGLIPPGGDKRTHARERALLKDIVLGLNYGMGLYRLADDLQLDRALAGQLLQSFRERYARMVAYGEQMVTRGITLSELRTRLDWRLHVREIIPSKAGLEGPKPSNLLTLNTLKNWPVQANAAEILRLAVIEATAQGVALVATLHDALLIEAPEALIDTHVALTRQAMRDASATILVDPTTGVSYPLRVDATIVRWPAHYREGESQVWWDELRALLREVSGQDVEECFQAAPVGASMP